MVNVFILVSDHRKELTIEGSLELFGQLLATLNQGAPDAERRPARAKSAEVKPRGGIHRFAQDDRCGAQDDKCRAHDDSRGQAESLAEGDA
jgi:hypothetical protein